MLSLIPMSCNCFSSIHMRSNSSTSSKICNHFIDIFITPFEIYISLIIFLRIVQIVNVDYLYASYAYISFLLFNDFMFLFHSYFLVGCLLTTLSLVIFLEVLLILNIVQKITNEMSKHKFEKL